MRAALAVAVVFIARFAAGAWFDPGRDGDIAWQRWLGLRILQTGHLPNALGLEAFTAAHAPWVPQEWALSLAIALTLNTPLFVALVAVTVLAAGSALWFTASGARLLGASTIAIAIAVFCVGEAMLESYGIRAQVFAWACLAALMYVLRCQPQRKHWYALPLVVLWANLHASVLLAPVLLALWTAGAAVTDRACTARVRHYCFLTLGAFGAVFASPLGYRLPLYALQLVHSPIRTAITEWQPTGMDAISFTAGALPLIALAAVLFITSKSRDWGEIFVGGCVTYLALSAVRNVPIAAIVLAPVVARDMTAWLPQRLRINSIFYDRGLALVFFPGILVAAVIAVLALVLSPQFKKNELPAEAIATLAAQPGPHRLYCEDFAWCSLALEHSNLAVFIDGRADPFPLPVWRDYVTIFHATGRWRAILDRRGVDALLVKNDRALGRAAWSLKHWRLLYAGKTYRLFVRENVARTAYKN